jgi:hypothetical protein
VKKLPRGCGTTGGGAAKQGFLFISQGSDIEENFKRLNLAKYGYLVFN